MKLLLAPWGDPKNWRRLTYRYQDRETKTCTSLKILQNAIAPDKTIIVGLETLAERGLNYAEVKSDAENKLSNYADNFGLQNHTVLIAPGVGSFPRAIFIGSALDYYYYVFWRISTYLLEHNDKKLEVHLDLTHGINYSTILTYRAVKEILELFSIFVDVEFVVYNADPFIQPNGNRTLSGELLVNVIEGVKPKPRPPDRKIKQVRTLDPIDLDQMRRRRLFGEELMCLREINPSEVSAFIGSLYNGIPLGLFTFYPDKEKLKNAILKTLEVYERHVSVEHENKLKVRKEVKFSENFKVYITAFLIAELLEKMGLVSFRKNEVALPDIRNIVANLFAFDERFKIKIEKDVYTLEEDFREKPPFGWSIYNDALGRPVGEPDARNFLAHSGFERNLTEIRKKDDGGVYVRYRYSKSSIVKKFCQQGLK